MVSQKRLYSRDDFVASNWSYDGSKEDHYGYFSVVKSLDNNVKEKLDAGLEGQVRVLRLLSRAASMMLDPSSLNEPFTACIQDPRTGRRSDLPDDFTKEELLFFEEIINDIEDPWLKARLADLLWLLEKPKKPEHAKAAIDSYTSHPIDDETWPRDVDKCWERAVRLCKQIGDIDCLNTITSRLFSAFCCEYPRNKFMTLWIADLLDRLKIDNNLREDIAASLNGKARELRGDGGFQSARSYFELALKKYQQCGDESGWLESLIAIAECFELEADSLFGRCNMVANSFYENALQAYRRMPTKHRDAYGVAEKIKSVRGKVTISGKASLEEMGLIKTPEVDVSDLVKSSKEYVSGKRSLVEALMYFTGLDSGPEYQKLVDRVEEGMQHRFCGSLYDSRYMSADGRVVAKIPPMNLNTGEEDQANQADLNRQLQQEFAIKTQLLVEGQILPALWQLLTEHRVTKEFLEAVSYQSPIVPEDRKSLLGYALWLGFEHDFGNAIHLLCPQVERIVRIQLKEAGAHTSNIDRDGIENENGLSTLIELPEATQIFGEDLVFEIKSVFTDSLGFNLRNEVAHGLLDDNSASTNSTVYAWWMILRLVIRSIMTGSFQKNDVQSGGDQPNQ